MNKRLLMTRLIFLTVVGSFLITGCGYDIHKAHPEFLDPARGYARIYDAIDIPDAKCGEPKYKFEYSRKNIPISEMSGHICLPTDQAQEIIRVYNEQARKNANCPATINEVIQ